MATIIMADGNTKQRDSITFQECQEIVGGCVEPVYLEDQVVLVNEDGLMLRLPPNENATIIAHQPIVGNAVVMDLVEASKVLDQGSC